MNDYLVEFHEIPHIQGRFGIVSGPVNQFTNATHSWKQITPETFKEINPKGWAALSEEQQNSAMWLMVFSDYQTDLSFDNRRLAISYQEGTWKE